MDINAEVDEAALAMMRSLTSAADRLADAGLATDAIAGALLAAAMNLWGNEHGFDAVAPWLTDAAQKAAAAYSASPSSAAH